MRAVLALVLLASTAFAADEEALDFEIKDYIDRREYDRQWGYDRHGIWNRPFLDFRAGVWWPSIDGPIKVAGRQVLDLTDVLNIEDEQPAPIGRLTLGYAGFEFIFDYSQIRFRGTLDVQATFEFGGETFEFAESLRTDITFQTFRAFPGIRLWHNEQLSLWFLTVIGVQRLRGSFQSTSGGSAAFDELLPIPLIGLSARGRHGHFVWDAEFLWLYIDLDVFGGGVLDARVDVGYAFNDWLSLRAGYRYQEVEAFFAFLEVEFIASGFFLQAVIEF